MWIEAFGAVAVCLLTVGLTGKVRGLALARGMLDQPNARSSHHAPTPRGGGISIVFATSVAVVVLLLAKRVSTELAMVLLGGGVTVAVVGLIDDRSPLSARVRLVAHMLAAAWLLWWLGDLPFLNGEVWTGAWSVVSLLIGAVAIVWVLNLFNFMDGIDGIAASESIFVALSGALLAHMSGAHEVAAASLMFSAACCGFLVWNWPPAKIFMGDAGSGYLGYIVSALALFSAQENPMILFAWLILGGAFFVDATVTLLRRLLRGERIYEAHRSHAYQWLARRWHSHGRVTVVATGINVGWLFPCALLSTWYPTHAGWIALGGLAPLVVCAVLAGSGRPEIARASSEVRNERP